MSVMVVVEWGPCATTKKGMKGRLYTIERLQMGVHGVVGRHVNVLVHR